MSNNNSENGSKSFWKSSSIGLPGTTRISSFGCGGYTALPAYDPPTSSPSSPMIHVLPPLPSSSHNGDSSHNSSLPSSINNVGVEHVIHSVDGSNTSGQDVIKCFQDYEDSVQDAWTFISEDGEVVVNNSLDEKKSSITSTTSNQKSSLQNRTEKIESLLSSSNSTDMTRLRDLSWPGLHPSVRERVWKLLCNLPTHASPHIKRRKVDEYFKLVGQYFDKKEEHDNMEMYRQIHIDIPRMRFSIFQQKYVQLMFERILYIWAIRHPASGYVQGINDLLTPFFLVYLQSYLSRKEKSEEQPSDKVDVCSVDVQTSLSVDEGRQLESDCFWSLTKVLDCLHDHYTEAQPGIQRKVKMLQGLIQRTDAELHSHLINHEVEYIQFSFRWMNNILLRELPINSSIRLWDSYLSEDSGQGFSHFHVYVCAAFLLSFKREVMEFDDFHTILMFLQNLPTSTWTDRDVEMIVAKGFELSSLFSTAHLTQ